MKQFFAIIEETFREAKNKWTLAGFFIFSTILIVIAFFVFQSQEVKEAMQRFETTSFGNQDMTRAIISVSVLNIFYTILSNILYVVIICVGIFATSGLINSQLEKGTIDLLLSKPVPRWKYILGRYTGSVLIIFLETFWFILGIWIVASSSIGIWNPSFLLCTVFITLGFAGIYSIVVCISIVSRSSALSIIVGIGLFFINYLISIGHSIETMVSTNSKSWLSTIANILYYIFPSSSDMGSNMTHLLTNQPLLVLPIFLTIGLSIVYLTLGMWAFAKKEF
ncbi:MAG TPA: ABC transporter permease subunit [Candidatus Kapabacteria bacterium]|nr:ABC transporter permease subunit [Candidatus Kapabacteria bacterium]